MWYHLKLTTKTGQVLMDVKVTVDPRCDEPGVYNIMTAASLVGIFSKLVEAINKFGG